MQNLRYLRDAKNITQSKLASMLSVARTTVTMWETGSHEPGIKTMQKVADMFDVPVEFLGGTGIFENWGTIVDHFAEIYDAISSDIPADLYMHNFSGEITLKSWLLKIMVYGKQDLAIINWFKFAIASKFCTAFGGSPKRSISSSNISSYSSSFSIPAIRL